MFANFVKPIVTTITLFHAVYTNFVTVAIQYFLKLKITPKCSDFCYSVEFQRYNLSEMCTMIYQYRHVANHVTSRTLTAELKVSIKNENKKGLKHIRLNSTQKFTFFSKRK